MPSARIELTTYGLGNRCSIHLSYEGLHRCSLSAAVPINRDEGGYPTELQGHKVDYNKIIELVLAKVVIYNNFSMEKQITVEELKQICQNIFKFSLVEFAYIYGSFAQGSARKWSDLDIALMVADSAKQDEYFSIEMEISKKLEEKIPKTQCDVRIFNSAPVNFKIQIVQYGKLIYSANESKRVEFETRTRDEYFDFLPFIANRNNYFEEVFQKNIIRRKI